MVFWLRKWFLRSTWAHHRSCFKQKPVGHPPACHKEDSCSWWESKIITQLKSLWLLNNFKISDMWEHQTPVGGFLFLEEFAPFLPSAWISSNFPKFRLSSVTLPEDNLFQELSLTVLSHAILLSHSFSSTLVPGSYFGGPYLLCVFLHCFKFVCFFLYESSIFLIRKTHWGWNWIAYGNSHRNADKRRQWYPIPVLLPGKSHGRRSLVGCRPWGR